MIIIIQIKYNLNEIFKTKSIKVYATIFNKKS